MKCIPVNDKGHFLGEKQKEIKDKIMQELIDAFYSNIEKESSIFLHDPQALVDMSFSICIMFSREIIVHLLHMSNLEHKRKEIMKNYCSALIDEVNHKIKSSMV